MQLQLPIELAQNYTSKSQIARVITESWALENLPCPHCGSSLTTYPNNTKTRDFICGHCATAIQLKSQRKSIGKKILDSAYSSTVNSILQGIHPSLAVLEYDHHYQVRNLLFIHQSCIGVNSVVPRNPLKPTARRAGHILCSYNLEHMPALGRIPVIEQGNVRPQVDVQGDWHNASRLLAVPSTMRGWTLDVWRMIEKVGQQFTLAEIYHYEQELAALYPHNHHIKDKIRQQLQQLRDLGLIVFEGAGTYIKSQA